MKRLPKLFAFIINVVLFFVASPFIGILWLLGANNSKLMDVLTAMRDVTDEN